MAKSKVKIHPRDTLWGIIVFILVGVVIFTKFGGENDIISGFPCFLSAVFSLYLLALVFRPFAQIKSPDNLFKQDLIVIGLMLVKFLYSFLLAIDIPMLMLVMDVGVLICGLIYVYKNKAKAIVRNIELDSLCPKCGKAYAWDDEFCRNCGMKRVK